MLESTLSDALFRTFNMARKKRSSGKPKSKSTRDLPPRLRRAIVRCAHKPTMSFYSRFPALGEELSSEFPDWQYRPTSLILHNKSTHRLLQVGTRGFTMYSDNPREESSEFPFIAEAVETVANVLKAQSFEGVTLDLFFACQSSRSFAELNDLVVTKMLAPDIAEEHLLGRVHDHSVTIQSRWGKEEQVACRVSPMSVPQWFEINEYDLNRTFDKQSDFDAFRESLPDPFLFVGTSHHSVKNIKASALKKFAEAATRNASGLALDVYRYCVKGSLQ